jgi:hypothetical protein
VPDRYSGLAGALARRNQGGEGRGFWRGVGDVLSGTPIGRLLHGDLRGAWNATPAGMAVNGLRGMFGNRGPSVPAGTPMGAFGPTTGGYGTFTPGVPSAPTWGGTDWTSEISGGQPATQAGPWQGAPALLPGQAPSTPYQGAAQTMGAVGAGLGGNQAGGLGRLMTNTIPWRQSGTTFVDRQQEF